MQPPAPRAEIFAATVQAVLTPTGIGNGTMAIPCVASPTVAPAATASRTIR